jgi:hypothetical protein
VVAQNIDIQRCCVVQYSVKDFLVFPLASFSFDIYFLLLSFPT